MKSKKKLIIVICIILIIALASAVFAYLFLMTDIFKSKEELFAKYFSQNLEAFGQITQLKSEEVFKNLENENKYESNTDIKIIHSEGGEISNPLNNLRIKLDIQKDKEQQYLYADGKVLYADEKYLQAEIMKNQDLYGIRFSDAVLQFITIRNDENLESVANSLGIDSTQLQEVINIIDGNKDIADMQELDTFKDKYLSILTREISKGTFEKQSKAMITYNNVTTTTNAYSISLSSEQVKNIIIEILNNVKNETAIQDKLQTVIDKELYIEQIDKIKENIDLALEIPEVKVTVYEQNQQTIRTVLEIGSFKITIENTKQENELKTNINVAENNTAMQIDVQITNKKTDSQENFEIAINFIGAEGNYKISFSNEAQWDNNQIQSKVEINSEQDITRNALILENTVNIGKDFEKTISIDASNNIILNDKKEENRKAFIERLEQIVSKVTSERLQLLMNKFELKNEGNTPADNQISQTEINKFNAKFEFYTGDEVSAENVKMLLDIAKDHLGNYEITDSSTQQSTENIGSQNQKINIKLTIEKDALNEEGVNKILEKISTSKKYKVSIFYKDSNSLIDYITISEV